MAAFARNVTASALLLGAGFAVGAQAQMAASDDAYLTRLEERDAGGARLCAAWDINPNGGLLGKWSQRADGHCHIADFMRWRAVAMVFGGAP